MMKKIISFIRKYDEMIVTVIVMGLAIVCLLTLNNPQILNLNLTTDRPIIRFITVVTFSVLLVTLKWLINRTTKNKKWKINLFNIVWILYAVFLVSVYMIKTFYIVQIDALTIEIVSKIFSIVGQLTFFLKIFTIIKSRKNKNELSETIADNPKQTDNNSI